MQLAARARQQLPRAPKAEKGASRSGDVFELWEPDSVPVEEEKGDEIELDQNNREDEASRQTRVERREPYCLGGQRWLDCI